MTAPHRVLRYGLFTSALVLLVCAVLATVAGTVFASANSIVGAAQARTFGTVTAVDGDTVSLSWAPSGAPGRVDRTVLAGPPPPVGTRTEVAYDPTDPTSPLIPGAAVLAAADRALSTLVLVGVVAVLVLLVGTVQVVGRRRSARQPPRSLAVRRVRVQAGVAGRSWLETETAPPRWIPVHFDPILLTLPSPGTVRFRGDPAVHRLVAVEIDGRVLWPSGPVRGSEPRGRRTDNPTAPDASTHARAVALTSLRRRLLADLPLLTPAPLIALLWTFVDGAGVAAWAGTSALLAALALFHAAVRGTDPS